MKRMHRCGWTIVVWCLLVGVMGCGEGTDVGNPTIPSAVPTTAPNASDVVAAWLGTYEDVELVPDMLVQEPDGAPPAPVVSPSALPACPTAGETPRVTRSPVAGQVLLSGFFSESSFSDPLSAMVTTTQLDFLATAGGSTLECTGTLQTSQLSLTCEWSVTGQSTTCLYEFVKQ